MIGQTLSHFRITAKLGEGGMGEVYRAVDTKLDREVAIKVLPEALTTDPERLARFEREAKVLAALNHPNIAGIHQIEEADGQQLLVMELVEGEELGALLDRGGMAVEEAVGIVLQVVQGLEAAHERGIVHRDLKPANLKVTADGQVKILDFGLAKAHEAAQESSPDMTRSPTLTAQMTQAGVILGTAAYMSPEQARGQEADPRSDIWSLGVVFFEMLSGDRLFAEPTVSDTLAAVLRADFDWDSLPDGTPLGVRRVLRRCLQREPKQRYHAAADVRIDLEEGLGEEDEPILEVAPAVTGTSRLPWILAASAAAVALVVVLMTLRPEDDRVGAVAAPRVVASILPPDGTSFVLDQSGLSLSPDGGRLAFIASDEAGDRSIWVRSISRGTTEKIEGTEEAQAPFWSPDGRSLGFNQDGEVKILDLENGFVEVLMPQGYSSGAAWSSVGEIVFGDNDEAPLRAVKETGGAPRPVTEPPEGGDQYFGPDFLRGGDRFLFHVRRYANEDQLGLIRIGALDGSPPRDLLETYSRASFVEPGFLVWWHQGSLRAQRFDVDRLELVGDPFAIASNVRFDPRSAAPAATLSDTGTLVFQSGGRVAGNQLVWYSRQGESLGTIGEPGSLYGPRLSPDGTRIALDISGDSNQGDIWVLDAVRGSGTRICAWPEDDSAPTWSPDGRELMFFSARGGDKNKVFRVGLGGTAEPELVLAEPGVNVGPRVWSKDGRTLLVDRGEGDAWGISALDLDSGEMRTLIEPNFESGNGTLSPDGQWMAYDSSESGRSEVYLVSLLSAESRLRVSTAGGKTPLWSADGTEIFFASAELDAILTVPVTIEASGPVLGSPEKLFDVELKSHGQRQFDTIDGERFLVNAELNTGGRTPLTLVLNWTDGLLP